HQAELRDGKHMRSGFVASEPFLHQIIDCLLVSTALHVDEIAYDQTTDVAQPKLARDFICRLELCLQNCFLHIAAPFVASGIYINRYQRFSLVDHNIPATLQPHLPVKSVVNLFLYAVSLENRCRTIVKMDPISGAPGNKPNHFDHSVC